MKGFRFLLLVMAICLASGVKAQILNSEVLFFHYYNNTVDGQKEIITNPIARIKILRVKNGILESIESTTEEVVNNLKRNINYYNNNADFIMVSKRHVSERLELEYDSNMSNVKWHVWSVSFNILRPESFYFALKKDYSEYIEWKEPDTFIVGDEELPFGRSMYKGYTKEQLLKLTLGGKRDFLN